MSRRQLAGIVTRQSDVAGVLALSVSITCGEVWVFSTMLAKGKRGVTCRDFNGADLRHYIRNLKNKGVGIDHRWKKDAFSRHKRWWLKDGHSFEDTSKKKPATGRMSRVSNPNVTNANSEGFGL